MQDPEWETKKGTETRCGLLKFACKAGIHLAPTGITQATSPEDSLWTAQTGEEVGSVDDKYQSPE